MAKKAEKKSETKKAAPAKKAAAAKPVAKAAPVKSATKAAPAADAKPAKEAKAEKPAKAAKAETVPAPKAEKPTLKLVTAEPQAAAPAKEAKAPKSKSAGVKKTKPTKAEIASSEEEARWHELHEKHKAEKPQSYDMKAKFETGKPLQHKLLGWGWILSNENDRLEVLFREGRKMLISNYNPNR